MYKSELNKQENKKDKIYVYKKYFYKLILENAKTKYEEEENTIMFKSLSYILEDLFNENNNDEINSKEMLINNNENNKKISFNKMKQMSTLSLPEKNMSEINNEIISNNINIKRNNKNNKDEKKNLNNNLEYLKKLKSPSNNYRNIYYYNIINSKKIINNNNFKKDYNKNRQTLPNKKIIIKKEKPLYFMDYSVHNYLGKINPANLSSYFKNIQSNISNYSSSTAQLYNKTEQNKYKVVSLNKKINNKSIANGIMDNYNNINGDKKESYKKYDSKILSKKIKSVKFLVKHIPTKKKNLKKSKN